MHGSGSWPLHKALPRGPGLQTGCVYWRSTGGGDGRNRTPIMTICATGACRAQCALGECILVRIMREGEGMICALIPEPACASEVRISDDRRSAALDCRGHALCPRAPLAGAEPGESWPYGWPWRWQRKLPRSMAITSLAAE